MPVYGTGFLVLVFGADFWYVCQWHKNVRYNYHGTNKKQTVHLTTNYNVPFITLCMPSIVFKRPPHFTLVKEASLYFSKRGAY